MEIAEFLLARIAEDEAVAREAVARNGATWSIKDLGHNGARITGATEFGNPRSYGGDDSLWDDEGALGMFAETAAHVVRHDPARVLAECESKRRIAAIHAAVIHGVYPPAMAPACRTCGEFSEYAQPWPCPTIRLLALPYASHPDYHSEWSPLASA